MTTAESGNLTRAFGVPRKLAIDAAVFVGRALMAYLFIVEGYGKITSYADVAAYMQGYGVAPFLLPVVIVTEIGGGLLILTGLMTRPAAVALAGFAILTALLFHNNGADVDQAVQFKKNFAIAGGFLILAAFGPGGWSPDDWWTRLARDRR
jgi:putative oxidoreductase